MEGIIRKTWRNNHISPTLVVSIPSELALKHGIKEGCNLVFENRPEGIVFKRLVIP